MSSVEDVASIDASAADPSQLAAADEVTAASASVPAAEAEPNTDGNAEADAEGSEEEMEMDNGSDQAEEEAPSAPPEPALVEQSSAAPTNTAAAASTSTSTSSSSARSTRTLISVLSKPKSSMGTSGGSAKPRVRFLADDEEEGLPSIEDDASGSKKKKARVGGAVATASMLSAAELMADAPAQPEASNKAKTKKQAQQEAQSLAEQQAQLQQQALLQAIAPPSLSSNQPHQQQDQFQQQQQQAAFYQQQQAYQQQQFQQQQAQLTPEERITQTREQIEKEPRDGDAWLQLLQLLQSKDEQDLDEIKKTYEDMLEIFPYAAKQWIAYIDLLLAQSDFPGVEALFSRCLRLTPSLDLWRSYLSYTRRVNPMPPWTGTGPAANAQKDAYDTCRKVIEGAYDFALSHIGFEREAGAVWLEYAAFLKERRTASPWEEGQKMDAIRKVYQRAVSIPMSDVEAVWRDYDAYENSVNRTTAKKFLAEYSAAYMTARGAQRELGLLLEACPRHFLPRIPSWSISTGAAATVANNRPIEAITIQRERGGVEAWKKYIRKEESNPLLLDDLKALQARVISAYKKAIAQMQFYPEIWYNVANYHLAISNAAEAVTWLQQGLESCPGSFLLTFALVEQLERTKQLSSVPSLFEKLLESVNKRIDARQAQLDQSIKAFDADVERAAEARKEARVKAKEAAMASGQDVEEAEGEEEKIAVRNSIQQRHKYVGELQTQAEKDLVQLKQEASLVWIKQMQFLRRSEGIRPTRLCFGKARKSPHATWHIYEASAMIEFHCSKETRVATNVFELAIKTFPTDPDLIIRYLEFLLGNGDETNARALFERVITTLPSDKARPVWERWGDYEYNFGDLASITRLESRLIEAYPDDPEKIAALQEEQQVQNEAAGGTGVVSIQPMTAVDRLMERNRYGEIDVIPTRDLGILPDAVGGAAVEASQSWGNGGTPNLQQQGHQAPGQPLANPAVKRRFNDAAPSGPRGASPVPPAAGHDNDNNHMAKRAKVNANGGQNSAETGHVRPAPVARSHAGPSAAPPPGVQYFLSILPSKNLFDGPIMPAEEIAFALQSTLGNPMIPDPPAYHVGFQGGPGGAPMQQPPMHLQQQQQQQQHHQMMMMMGGPMGMPGMGFPQQQPFPMYGGVAGGPPQGDPANRNKKNKRGGFGGRR